MNSIDTEIFSKLHRERGIDREARTVRIARLIGSQQAEDLSEPTNCGGYGRVRHFRRESAEGWPDNPLPIDPAAKALGEPASDILRAQVFQNAVCNWRCWYCYVDFPLLSGNDENSELLSAAGLLDLFEVEPERARVIDLSGGQPDLVPEWAVWMAEELGARGQSDSIYLWSDDNLSNDYFWERLDDRERRVLEDFDNYGKVCCFKGFDEASFAFNTGATPDLFSRQFQLFERLLRETEIDLYAYATFTSPDSSAVESKLAEFLDRLQEIDERLPLRLVPLRVEPFTPVQGRMEEKHRLSLEVQDEAIAAWRSQISGRFGDAELSLPITEIELRRG